MEINIVTILRVVVCVVSLLCCIIAMALPHWVTSEQKRTNVTVEVGLWKRCTRTKDGDTCMPLTFQTVGPSDVMVGLMVFLGVVLLIGVLGCAVLHVISVANKPMVVYVGGVMAAFAAILQLIAFSMFADNITMLKESLKDQDDVSISFGAAFGLDIVTCILSLVTAVFFLVPQLRATSES